MDAAHAAQSTEAGGDPLAAAMRNAKQREMRSAGRDDHDRDHDQGAGTHETPRRTISAFLVGLKSRSGALFLQCQANESREEPLTAILPGATLLEVWDSVAGAEQALIAISALILVMGLAGMLIALLTGLSERRREMAVLRAVGARPWHIFALLLGEATFLTMLGIALGIAALYLGLGAGQALAGAACGAVRRAPRALGHRVWAYDASGSVRSTHRSDPCVQNLPPVAGGWHDDSSLTRCALRR